MKQTFGTILILVICFLIGFSKSKTLKNITEAQVIDVKQISEEAGHGHCGNDWLVAPNYLGIVQSTYIRCPTNKLKSVKFGYCFKKHVVFYL